MRTFPRLAGARFGYANLNEWAIKLHPQFSRTTPKQSENGENIVAWLQRHMNVDVVYGGWFEDRSYFLGDTYLKEEKKFLHLGVDVCVPAGTEVAVTRVSRVLRIDCDTPLKHGWGTTVACELVGLDRVLLYAHLGPQVSCAPGDLLHPGHIIGRIGERKDNGDWFPHLHAQAMVPRVFNGYTRSKEHWDAFDGYGKESERRLLLRHYPDPLPYLGLF